MRRTTSIITAMLLLIVLANITFAEPPNACPANGKLKVFILSGQSNMVGFGQLSGDSPGTMETLLKSNPKAYGHLVDKDGNQAENPGFGDVLRQHRFYLREFANTYSDSVALRMLEFVE